MGIESASATEIPAGAMEQLVRKNVLLFRRNGKAVMGEVILTIMYFGILIALSLTVVRTIHDADPIPSGPSSLYSGSPYGYVTYAFTYGCIEGADPSKNCTDGSWNPGQLGFSDGVVGCSATLTSFKDNHVDICSDSFVDAYRTPSCLCISNSTLSSYADVEAQNLTAALLFNPDDFQDFTAHVSGTPSFDPLFTSPYNPQPASWDSGRLVALLQPIYNGLLSASSSPLSDLDFNFALKQMGYEEWEETGIGAMNNFPMYLCVIFMSSVSTIVVELMNERKRKNDSGLIMSGTTPVVYLSSWLLLALARQLVTVVFSTLFSLVFFVQYTSVLVTFTTFSLMSLYSILFGLAFAMKFSGSKQAQNFLIWSTIVSTAPIYANSGLFLDVTANALIPPSVSLGISAVLPQFAMANMLAEMLLRNNKYDNGIHFGNMFRTSRLGGSFGVYLLLLLMGIAVQALLIWKFVVKSGYVTSSDDKASDEAYREATAESTIDDTVAVSIRDLQKSFDNGAVKAVDGLTVDFNMNEITSFLGHNGAGKTTTIQILTGLHAATGGDAFVCGKSINHNMDAVREMISVCPQENILWDTLTVEEHCKLWFGIRKVPVSDAMIMQSLSEVGLHDKIDTQASDLSGGQKRKLMVALAFIGNPKVVYLDEPTAGMDTQARRDIWDLLRRKKEGRAIILTTHFMDEADILGDRIAIIHSGKLQVVGNSDELKEQFGAGNHLNVSVSDRGDRRKIFSLIKEVVPTARLDVPDEVVDDAGNFVAATDIENHIFSSGNSGDLQLVVPNAVDSTELAKLCRRLDEAKKSSLHGLQAYGFMSTTLEEVFVKLGEMEEDTVGAIGGQPSATGSGGGVGSREISSVGPNTVSNASPLLPKITYKKPSSFQNVLNILQRRLICETRNFKAFLFNVVIPAVFVMVMVGMLQINWFPEEDDAVVVKLDAVSLLVEDTEFNSGRFQIPVARNGSLPTKLDEVLPDLYSFQTETTTLPETTDVTLSWAETGDYGCFEAYLIKDTSGQGCQGSSVVKKSHEAPSSLEADPAAGTRIGGLAFSNGTNTLPDITVLFNTSSSASMLGLTSYIYNALINDADAGADGLKPKMFPLPSRPQTLDEKKQQDTLEKLIPYSIAPMFLVYGFLAQPSQIVYDLVSERTTGLKHLHILMGISPSEYWAANLAWDLATKWGLTCSLAMVLMSLWAQELANLSVWVLLLSFLASTTSFAYVLSFLFDEPNIASGWCSNFLMMGFIFTFAISLIVQLPSMEVSDGVKDGLTQLGMILSPGQSLSAGLTNYLMCNAFHEDPWQWSVGSDDENPYLTGGILQPVVYLWVQFFLFLFLLVFAENKSIAKGCLPLYNVYYHVSRSLGTLFCKKKARDEVSFEGDGGNEGAGAVEDEDVKDERAIIDSQYSDEVESAIKISHLRKEFLPKGNEKKGTVAVDDLCLRINPGECFALLGTNGAGKSTTLNMLLRVLEPSSGQAFIEGVDVTRVNATDDLFLNMGYCPQANALFELMTGEEMLDFFVKIRGVTDASRAQYVQNCINNANLQAHAKKRCGKYSGGNKRKLCFAIAICGDPRMTVLDESSAGVDVAARKKLWSVLSSLLNRGNTVIMTTHHMEEASQLAHRAAIMVDGKLACLGTSQKLQEKYGGGYELSISCANGQMMGSLLEKVESIIGKECEVLERTDDSYVRLGLGQVVDGQAGFSIADVFELMSAEKKSGTIESFNLNQTGLEEVFLSLTQSRSRKGKRVKVSKGAHGGLGGGGGDGGGQRENLSGVLNLPFTPFEGLKRHERVPADILAKGVSQAEWDEYVNNRFVKVSKQIGCLNTQKGCTACCLPMIIPGLSCVVCSVCKRQGDSYDGAMRDWQQGFNTEVLERRGVYCKTQSKAEKVVDMTGQKSDNAKVMRWVAFAFTEEGVESLKDDPHVDGKLPSYKGCCGFDTSEYVIHPGNWKEV
ncbi:hypothetical protein TrVE_jg12263 [Triparma verrucosa]|uniref:ABC transporter domain-containing protein n=1 Tax=Triparma verrucosa TaxID=1606542 RepID=A0A9W7BQ75_9STRA|nr:hypothetical protein TrVE_jg12263 [Triparma verrucosa]